MWYRFYLIPGLTYIPGSLYVFPTLDVTDELFLLHISSKTNSKRLLVDESVHITISSVPGRELQLPVQEMLVASGYIFFISWDAF